ncbi:MAG: hypothetical protein K2H64_12350 [Desulfovibrio sp.]|nr:hypothetical protein [Desulfovibrio sp.]
MTKANAAPFSLFEEDKPDPLTEEQERYKRAIYEKLNPRRRKFIDKIGYDVWNPFQEPKEPLDIRRERAGRTLQELAREFMRDAGNGKSAEWKKGAMECAMGIIKKDEKYQGVFDFCLWYTKLLEKEGQGDES